MRLSEFVTEAVAPPTPGFLNQLKAGIGAAFGSGAKKGENILKTNFYMGWKTFEQWRAQSNLDYATTATSTPAAPGVLTGAKISKKFYDNPMKDAMKEVGIPLDGDTGITQDQARQLIFSYTKV